MGPIFKFLETNFYQGYSITNVEVKSKDKSKMLFFYLNPKSEPICPNCGGGHVSVDSVKEKSIRDSDFLGSHVTLVIKSRVIRCEDCDASADERIDFMSEHAAVTKRLEQEVMDLLKRKNGTVEIVAKRIGLDLDLCRQIQESCLPKAAEK